MGAASSVVSLSAASVDAPAVEASPSQETREDAVLPLERLHISVSDGSPAHKMPDPLRATAASNTNACSSSGNSRACGGTGGWAAASVEAAGGSLVTRSGTCTRNNSNHFDDDAAGSISPAAAGPTASSESASRNEAPDCGVPAEAIPEASNTDCGGPLGSSSVCRPHSSTSSNASCRVRTTTPVLQQLHHAQAVLEIVCGPLGK